MPVSGRPPSSPWRVELTRRAVKDLGRLGRADEIRVERALQALAANPLGSPGVKPLVGKAPWLRLRVGDVRVLYRRDPRPRVLLVARIVDRRDLERAVGSLNS
ncbi:MAG: type II toxin-antitoxin system RelE/ParE family toxin [Acidobacteria bacterium]|nr:type II toxin-antitoxin system RelE/ParE family toxin [Acidobacteriota bacterium]